MLYRGKERTPQFPTPISRRAADLPADFLEFDISLPHIFYTHTPTQRRPRLDGIPILTTPLCLHNPKCPSAPPSPPPRAAHATPPPILTRPPPCPPGSTSHTPTLHPASARLAFPVNPREQFPTHDITALQHRVNAPSALAANGITYARARRRSSRFQFPSTRSAGDLS